MIEEGNFDEDGRLNGWGRRFSSDGLMEIGWWKDNNLWGNSRMINKDGSIKEEGWFEGSFNKTGPFKKDSTEYKYWEMKDKYFIK